MEIYYSVHCDKITQSKLKDKIQRITHNYENKKMEYFLVHFKEEIENGTILCINPRSDIQNNHKVLVVEPHADDGILSVGGCILNMANSGYDILSCCIFSMGGQEKIRQNENILVWEKILKGKAEFASYTDGAYRLEEGDRLLRQNTKLFFKVINYLRKLIDEEKPDIILGPLAIGGHSDHVITNKALIELYKEDKRYELWFYEDFPYANNERYYYIRALSNVMKEFALTPVYENINKVMEDKISLFMAYSSQHVYKRSKIYTVVSEYASAIRLEGKYLNGLSLETGYYERFWKCK